MNASTTERFEEAGKSLEKMLKKISSIPKNKILRRAPENAQWHRSKSSSSTAGAGVEPTPGSSSES